MYQLCKASILVSFFQTTKQKQKPLVVGLTKLDYPSSFILLFFCFPTLLLDFKAPIIVYAPKVNCLNLRKVRGLL